jgi:hypothetical protein
VGHRILPDPNGGFVIVIVVCAITAIKTPKFREMLTALRELPGVGHIKVGVRRLATRL